MINSKKLLHFIEVAHSKSFNEAALSLHISQPALSRSIQSLEHELGLILFDRCRRALELTSHGVHLLKYAQTVQQNIENFEIATGRLSNLQAGYLRVGTGPLPADHVGAVACAKFLKDFPHIELTLSVDDPEKLIEKLSIGDLDVLITDPMAISGDHDLVKEPLTKFPAIAIARKGHPLENKEKLDAKDLINYPLGSISKVATQVFMQRLGLTSNNVAKYFNYHCNSAQLLITTIKNSDLIGVLLSSNVQEELNRGELCILDVPQINHQLHSDYSVITYRPRLNSLAADAFIKICKQL
ncbi:LysR family transcriptional regulator [Reinekea marina]|uniref:LysR family transcriptional regulator n=1 Tax=Reinekea marina TaxID=1310421 RepID=A0ABV7WQN1_9GAMM|nr:LysR family transcriptional regulator [Reinekea marina]MDN3648646.1 LysR family transcriptional regulator [Reinekea marina]